MALAKSLQHLSSGFSPPDQGMTSYAGLTAMRIGHGQTLKGEELHATIALDAGSRVNDLASRDLIGKNALVLRQV